MSEQSTSVSVIYKPIPGHKGYRAGSDGSIWSCLHTHPGRHRYQVLTETWRELVPLRWHQKGRRIVYHAYKLRHDDGQLRQTRGSILILETFVGPRPDGLVACHTNGNSLDNTLGNLRWDTPESNGADVRRHGSQRGSRNGHSKLTEDIVRQIRQARAQGVPRVDVARLFGVSRSTVQHIDDGRKWAYVI